MADTKHPAELLADVRRHESGLTWDLVADEQLRRIPALEAELERKSEAIQKLWKERDELRAEVERWSGHAAYFEAERNELRVELDAARKQQ
jgi:uncharacterized coiled-coil DUF342 family protein